MAFVTECGVPSYRDAAPLPSSTSGSRDGQLGYVADLHIHSKYSRACSRELELPNLARWARWKGIAVLGTGDITHPAWREHIREHLRPAEPGLFRLPPELEAEIDRSLPPQLASTPAARFLLSVEISTIYKRDGRTRKVHHLVYLPDLAAADRFAAALGRIGNLASDGRPILGLDSRDLLEITLTSSPDAYLVPAHIWTPWFSALGSKSGFDAIADCYADLADHIFAVETGLSSDPAMNYRVSSLDKYQLISCSDAHSLPALGREATVFTEPLDYFGIKEALRTGDRLQGTIEFFPEEGKYHADGHRACGVNWQPEQTRAANGRCPECGRPLTVGVLSRVTELADRPADAPPPPHAKQVTHLVPLPEILSEIYQVGPKTKTVAGKLNQLVAALGSELSILTEVPLPDLQRAGGEVLAEAIRRLRAGEVHRTPGYDGEYGVIRLFAPGERDQAGGGSVRPTALFEIPETPPAPTLAAPVSRAVDLPSVPGGEPVLAGMEEVGTGLLDRLDAMQRVAASAPGGPLLVVAGPGTGKTRTLTHRIAYLCAELGVSPDECLAITFTRRAADELRERLQGLLGKAAAGVTVATFHALGLAILREHPRRAGLRPDFTVVDDPVRTELRTEAGLDTDATDAEAWRRYRKLLRKANLVDLDELVTAPLELLRAHPELAEEYQQRWPWVFVDEYQDVDADQYELLRLLTRPDGNLYAIGDPDQAIYSFRGADVGFFLRFSQDFVDAQMVRLSRNYRSTPPIIAAAVQAIAPSTLVRGRRLEPVRLSPDSPLIGRYQATSAADEAAFVARTIDTLVGGVSHRSLDSGRVDGRAVTDAVSFSDIAVLYRTDAQSGPVIEALQRAGVPVQKRTHNRLLDRPGVSELAHELTRAASAEESSDLTTRIKQVGQTLAERYDVPTLDPDEAVTVAPTDVWAAVELVLPLAERCGDDLPRFLAALAAGTEVDALDPRAEAVTLLTIHAAKGLEFPVVFLVGVDDGLLPHSFGSAGLTDEAVAEERRLFFVALTRAQDRLYLSHGDRPSRFLSVIDTGLFESLGETRARRPRHRQPRLL